MLHCISLALIFTVLHLTEKNKEEVSGTIESMKEGDKAIIVVNGQVIQNVLNMC